MKCVDTVVIFRVSRKIEYAEIQNSWQNGMSRSDENCGFLKFYNNLDALTNLVLTFSIVAGEIETNVIT